MFIDGGLTLAAPDTPTPLVDPDDGANPGHRVTNCTLQVPKGSAGYVAVGGENVVATPAADATGVQIYPGAAESFSVTDLSDVFVSASVADVRVLWHAKAL